MATPSSVAGNDSSLSQVQAGKMHKRNHLAAGAAVGTKMLQSVMHSLVALVPLSVVTPPFVNVVQTFLPLVQQMAVLVLQGTWITAAVLELQVTQMDEETGD